MLSPVKWLNGCCWVIAMLFFATSPLVMAEARKTVTLAAVNMPPYLDEALPDYGYAAVVARRALAQAGYQVEIRFYPPERARNLLATGKVDGLLPVAGERNSDETLLVTEGFPGAHIGLLKRRGEPIDYPADAPDNAERALRRMASMRFGAVRGGVQIDLFERAQFLRREYVTDDLQNLDKLALGRIDLMVVDRFRAGDLMSTFRPHLIGKLEFLNPPLFRSDFRVAFARQGRAADELKSAFDRGLASLRQRGEIDRILAAHGLEPVRQVVPGQKVLTIATVNNPEMLLMQRLGELFERQNPGVRLDWRVLEEQTLRRRLMSDLALGEGRFDVMTIGSFEAPLWAANGWLKSFDDVSGSYDLGDILPPVRDAVSYGGHPYALPFYGETSMTYYRRDLFEKAGLTMPAQPSYDDIRRFAAALHDPSHGVYGICLRGKAGWGENVTLVGTMVNSYGGRWFDADWQPELTSAAWKQAVSMYVGLLRQYGPPNATANGYNENLQLFAAGKCALWIDATVAAGTLFNPRLSGVSRSVAFAPAPIGTTQRGSRWLWVWALAVPASSAQSGLARQFVEWATGPAYVREVARREGWVAVPPGTRQSTYANPAYRAAAPFAEFVGASLLATQSQLPDRQQRGIQWVSMPEFPAIGHLVGSELSEAVAGNQGVVGALQRAQTGVERLLRGSGYLKR